ncbi:hypothetical protein LEP1GSC188_1970 [Leptospira weilii serovar Topaz str. LT2116]|uniref:Uncharacterized protein n=1 Tax=Leptospira weilii serovar Topaz str. LT2116 TaxID=1088540 RepID=M3H2F6_9LEPT|nr:hypothetical protein LEP1GSC188_1970 [Leptospira weilii serovar Topaz str. LT2116]
MVAGPESIRNFYIATAILFLAQDPNQLKRYPVSMKKDKMESYLNRLKTSYICTLRTSLSREEICEQIRNTLSISNIQILEYTAVLRSDG